MVLAGTGMAGIGFTGTSIIAITGTGFTSMA